MGKSSVFNDGSGDGSHVPSLKTPVFYSGKRWSFGSRSSFSERMSLLGTKLLTTSLGSLAADASDMRLKRWVRSTSIVTALVLAALLVGIPVAMILHQTESQESLVTLDLGRGGNLGSRSQHRTGVLVSLSTPGSTQPALLRAPNDPPPILLPSIPILSQLASPLPFSDVVQDLKSKIDAALRDSAIPLVPSSPPLLPSPPSIPSPPPPRLPESAPPPLPPPILTTLPSANISQDLSRVMAPSPKDLQVPGGVSEGVLGGGGGAPGTVEEDCDLSEGAWVRDDERPAYTGESCPFIDAKQNCDVKGRVDRGYQRWRWQPRSCHLARFDAEVFLELLRDKTLAIVGDSLSRNFADALKCIIHAGLPKGAKMVELRAPRGEQAYFIRPHNVTIRKFFTPFLVSRNHNFKKYKLPRQPKENDFIVEMDVMEGWTSLQADVTLLQSARWWQSKASFFVRGGEVVNGMQRLDAYEEAMVRVRDLVEGDQRFGIPLWQAWSTDHFQKASSCGREQLLDDKSALAVRQGAQRLWPERQAAVFGADVGRPSTHQNLQRFRIMNITALSSYRPDAHPGQLGSRGSTDCAHWCLPGVPDVWVDVFQHLLLKENTLNVEAARSVLLRRHARHKDRL